MPVVYDYGSTIVYQYNPESYYNGGPVATAEEYADRATAIAAPSEPAGPAGREGGVGFAGRLRHGLGRRY